jgi:hypothetical protein
MHLSKSDELHGFNLEEIESFLPVIKESKQLDINLFSVFKVTNDIETEIADVANSGDYDVCGIR